MKTRAMKIKALVVAVALGLSGVASAIDFGKLLEERLKSCL